MLRTNILKAASLAVAVAGSMAFGAVAQADTSTRSLPDFSAQAITAYTEAKASFTAGVAAELYPGRTSNRDMIMLRALSAGTDDFYYKAGRSFQEANEMSPTEIREFVSFVAQELRSYSLSSRINRGMPMLRLGAENGVVLVNIAHTLGLIEASGDQTPVPEGLKRSLRDIIDGQPPAAQRALQEVVNETRDNTLELAGGHDAFWRSVGQAMEYSHSNASFPPLNDEIDFTQLVDPFAAQAEPTNVADLDLR